MQQQLIENYQILEQIGQGAYGQVFKAQDRNTQQVVALKLQQFCSEMETEFTKQLCKAKFQNVLNHVEIFVKDEGFLSYTVIVTEYCNYKDLFEFIKTKTIDDQLLKEICYQISFGLWELSQVQILHRDIKPQNILVHQNDEGKFEFKICDLGISKLQQDAKTVNIGTPYYMAPELIGHGISDKYDNKVDIWAFGAMIAEFQTREPFFNGKSLPEVFRAIREKQICLSDLENKITDKTIRNLVVRMLSKNPYERPSAEEILNQIDYERFNSDKNSSQIRINNSNNQQNYDIQNYPNDFQQKVIYPQIQQVQSTIQFESPQQNQIQFQQTQNPEKYQFNGTGVQTNFFQQANKGTENSQLDQDTAYFQLPNNQKQQEENENQNIYSENNQYGQSDSNQLQNQQVITNQEQNQIQLNPNQNLASQQGKSKNYITNQVSLRAHLRNQKLITDILNEIEAQNLNKWSLQKKLDDHLKEILDQITIESIQNQY